MNSSEEGPCPDPLKLDDPDWVIVLSAVLATIYYLYVIVPSVMMIVRRNMYPIRLHSIVLSAVMMPLGLMILNTLSFLKRAIRTENFPCDADLGLRLFIFPFIIAPLAMSITHYKHRLEYNDAVIRFANRRPSSTSSFSFSRIKKLRRSLTSKNELFTLAAFSFAPVLVVLIIGLRRPEVGRGCYGCPVQINTAVLVVGLFMVAILIFLIELRRQGNLQDISGERKVFVRILILWSLGIGISIILMITDPFGVAELGYGLYVMWALGIYIHWQLCVRHVISSLLVKTAVHPRRNRREARAPLKIDPEAAFANSTNVFTPSRNEGGDPTLTLEFVLANERGSKLFMEHLTKEFNVENLIFLRKVEEWGQNYDSQTKKMSHAKARDIFETFCSGEDAPLQVNLCSGTQKELAQIFANDQGSQECAKHVFDTAYAEILELVRSDAFQRFKRTAPYRSFQEEICAQIRRFQMSGTDNEASQVVTA